MAPPVLTWFPDECATCCNVHWATYARNKISRSRWQPKRQCRLWRCRRRRLSHRKWRRPALWNSRFWARASVPPGWTCGHCRLNCGCIRGSRWKWAVPSNRKRLSGRWGRRQRHLAAVVRWQCSVNWGGRLVVTTPSSGSSVLYTGPVSFAPRWRSIARPTGALGHPAPSWNTPLQYQCNLTDLTGNLHAWTVTAVLAPRAIAAIISESSNYVCV